MSSYIDLGKKIYNMNNPREVRRMAVFVMRSLLHNDGMEKLEQFFLAEPVLQRFIDESPFALEQVTRAFFYKDSSFSERAKLIREHFEFCAAKLKDEALLDINSCARKGYVIWQQEFENIGLLEARLHFEGGQRKEGLFSIQLNLYPDANNKEEFSHLYQLMLWIAKDKENYHSLYIGAMQGPNMDEAREIIKKMTKACHGYRTKNLILYIAQAVSRSLGIEKIYAVTNEGYYANNHVRVDRKLKTSFSDFWTEAGGHPSGDSRFYELPLVETRKTIEEVPTRKRAVYRRRFAFMDEVDSVISDNMKKVLK